MTERDKAFASEAWKVADNGSLHLAWKQGEGESMKETSFRMGVGVGLARGRATASPPLWGECPRCNGVDKNCPRCEGEGRLPIYYTPAAWIAWHEENGLPVPVLDGDTGVWVRYSWLINDGFAPAMFKDVKPGTPMLLNLPGQPRPRADWRP